MTARFWNSQSICLIPSHANPVHTVMPHFLTHFNIIFPSTSSSLKMSLPFTFRYQNFLFLSHFPPWILCPAIPIFRDFINPPLSTLFWTPSTRAAKLMQNFKLTMYMKAKKSCLCTAPNRNMFHSNKHRVTGIETQVYYCPNETMLGTCRHILLKLSDVKFREYPFSSSRIVIRGQTGGGALVVCVSISYIWNVKIKIYKTVISLWEWLSKGAIQNWKCWERGVESSILA